MQSRRPMPLDRGTRPRRLAAPSPSPSTATAASATSPPHLTATSPPASRDGRRDGRSRTRPRSTARPPSRRRSRSPRRRRSATRPWTGRTSSSRSSPSSRRLKNSRKNDDAWNRFALYGGADLVATPARSDAIDPMSVSSATRRSSAETDVGFSRAEGSGRDGPTPSAAESIGRLRRSRGPSREAGLRAARQRNEPRTCRREQRPRGAGPRCSRRWLLGFWL